MKQPQASSEISWNIKANRLYLQGPLTRASVKELLPDLEQWKGICSIDLKDITEIDSAGLAVLARAIVSVCNHKPLWLNASEKTIALSELYGLDQFIHLSDKG